MSGPSLSQISHLFLSGVRDRAQQGSSRPQRKPPAAPAPEKPASVDLTPEEFREVFAGDSPASNDETAAAPPVRAVVASHLGARQFDAVRRYAATLAASGRRIGLIWIDADELRISTFEQGAAAEASQPQESSTFDARAISDAINELNCDLDCWLLAIANPKLAPSRQLLSGASHWALLSGADHDSIVSAYRALKGLASLGKPRVSLGVIDAAGPVDAEKVHRKLLGVAQQFLQVPIEAEPVVSASPQASEFEVMTCRAGHDKSQLAGGAHWQVVLSLLEQAAEEPAAEPMKLEPTREESEPMAAAPCPVPAPVMPQVASVSPEECEEVIDLVGGAASSVIDAVMRQSMSQIVECPLRPPMCPDARLAVDRERRLVVVAAAGNGLAGLRTIAQALAWAGENRALLSMALPQFSIDTHQLPRLRLLVDEQDASAEALRPLLQSGTCTVEAYRKVRWAGKTGLLLRAA